MRRCCYVGNAVTTVANAVPRPPLRSVFSPLSKKRILLGGDDLAEGELLALAHRAALLDVHDVANLGRVLLIVHGELLALVDELVVPGMGHLPGHEHRRGLGRGGDDGSEELLRGVRGSGRDDLAARDGRLGGNARANDTGGESESGGHRARVATFGMAGAGTRSPFSFLLVAG